jgi:hypothetical protein
MGSTTYDFLADSFLLNESNIENEYSDYSLDKLEEELQKYRQHCLDNYDALKKEVTDRESSLKVFSSIEKVSFDLLMQPCLYLDQFVIYDPLFKFTEIEGEVSRVASEYLGFKEKSLNKSELARTCAFLKKITPFIAADYVKILPASYHFEAPTTPTINFPKDYYNDILPKEILEYFYKNVEVRSMIQDGHGWKIQDNLYPCRGIHIDFADYNAEETFIYHLWEMIIDSVNEVDETATFRQTLPDTPPEINYFKAWVRQSVNSSSKAVFDKIYLENVIASELNATYMCDSNFTGNLITTHFGAKETIQTHTATEIINMELPFISNVNLETLMTIRKYEEDVFTNFRLELEKQFRVLRGITDPEELKRAKENIMHELNEVQVNKVNQQMKSVARNMISEAGLMTGGLIAAAQTGGLSLIASAIALGKGYKDYKDYQDKIKQNPSYLLWKVQK